METLAISFLICLFLFMVAIALRESDAFEEDEPTINQDIEDNIRDSVSFAYANAVKEAYLISANAGYSLIEYRVPVDHLTQVAYCHAVGYWSVARDFVDANSDDADFEAMVREIGVDMLTGDELIIRMVAEPPAS